MSAQRSDEYEKYVRAYQNPSYRMGHDRMLDAINDLAALPVRGAYLDVACGRGEMLKHATNLGYWPVQGTEVVPALIERDNVRYAEAHDLPFADKSFDVVTLFDVIEHLLPGDDEQACKELARVSRSHILLTANNRESHNSEGDILHINKRGYDEWNRLFRDWFPGTVQWIKGKRNYISEGWRIDL